MASRLHQRNLFIAPISLHFVVVVSRRNGQRAEEELPVSPTPNGEPLPAPPPPCAQTPPPEEPTEAPPPQQEQVSQSISQSVSELSSSKHVSSLSYEVKQVMLK